MAEYRLCYKKGKVGYAKSHAEYILRENNYKGKEDLLYKESGNFSRINSNFDENMAVKFWEAADYNERINSVAYREMEIMIPNEFGKEQAIEVIQNFVRKEIGNDYPYSFAIHESFSKETGVKNLHCHLMFSERKIDNIERDLEKFFKRANPKNIEFGGAKKDRTWQKKDRLLQIRKSWEIEANLVLEKYNFEERIDCRSLKERKEEAIKNNEFDKAEIFDREAINLSKKIIRKIAKAGYMSLTADEKAEVKKFNEAKEIKAKKLREYQIKHNQIIPSQEELVEKLERLNNLDEVELKRRTLNIISKGQLSKQLYELRNIEKNLIAHPQNEKLLSKQKDLQGSIMSIAEEHTLSWKYNRILEQLKRDKDYEIELYTSHLKNYYHVDFMEEKTKNQESKNQQMQNNFREKYQEKSIQELKYRLLELEQQDSRHHAMQVLSKYRLEGITQNIIALNKNIMDLRTEEQQIISFANPQEIKELKEKIFTVENQKINYENEYNLIMKELDKNNEKCLLLTEKINKTAEVEKEVIKQIISEYKENNLTVEEKLKQYINVIVDYEKTKRLYEYFSNNNLDEKHNKSIYLLHKRLNVMEESYLENFEKLNSLSSLNYKKVQKNLFRLKNEYIEKKNEAEQRYKKLENACENLKKLLSDKEVKNKYIPVDLIALNKITKGEYSLNFIKKENVKREISDIENKLKKSSFIRKFSLQRKLQDKKNILEKYISEEARLLKKYRGTDILKDKSSMIYKNLAQSLKKINKLKNESKAEINYLTSVIYKIRGLEDRKKHRNKFLELINESQKIVDTKKSVKDLLKSSEEQNKYNNFEIKLEKEKENSWEI